jgi:hypothetical protein
MAVLTDFFVAPASSAAKLLAGVGTKKLSHYETKSIDPSRLESLERLLKSEGETTILTDQDAEQWVFLVSPTLVALLAKLKKVDPVAKKWAPELKADGWTVAEAKQAISALVALAIEATAKKQDLLLRMSL